MKLARKIFKACTRLANRALKGRYITTTFGGKTLMLDAKWKHELSYLDYIKRGEINPAIGMDVWAFSQFVKPGFVTLDAGANIGFTAILAERAGADEIHCFEPDPRLTERLIKHCGGGKITVHPMALGNQEGKLKLCLSEQHNQGSTSNARMLEMFPKVYGKAKFVEVEVRTIDDLFPSKQFDFFKVDVEGAELATLKGAASLLAEKPPRVIYVEAFEEFFEEVSEFLLNYYKFAYRIACDASGKGKLFPLGASIIGDLHDDVYTNPPSYIFSSFPQDELSKHWSLPVEPIR